MALTIRTYREHDSSCPQCLSLPRPYRRYTCYSRIAYGVIRLVRTLWPKLSAVSDQAISGQQRLPSIQQLAPVVLATGLLGLPVFLLFASWMIWAVSVRKIAGLDTDMWLAGTWFLLAPGLIVAWERRLAHTLCVITVTTDEDRWSSDKIATLDNIMRYSAWPLPLVFVMLVATGYVLSRSVFAHMFGAVSVTGAWGLVGMLAVVWLGLSFGTGVWGVIICLVACFLLISPEVRWRPFAPDQAPGLEELSKFSYRTAVLFSMGGVFLPAVLTVTPRLTSVGTGLAFIVTASLVGGSVATFLIPSAWITSATRTQRTRVLERLADALQTAEAELLDEGCTGKDVFASMSFEKYMRVQTLVTLRTSVSAETAAPAAVWVAGRVFTLVAPSVVASVIVSVVGHI